MNIDLGQRIPVPASLSSRLEKLMVALRRPMKTCLKFCPFSVLNRGFSN